MFARRAAYELSATMGAAVVLALSIVLSSGFLLAILLTFFLAQSVFYGAFLVLTLRASANRETDPELLPVGKHLTVMQALRLLANHLDKIILWNVLGPISVGK